MVVSTGASPFSPPLGAAVRPARRLDPAAVRGIPAQCRISNKACWPGC